METFPPTTRERRPTASAKPERALTGRQARRADYARTQRAWKKNLSKCPKTILNVMSLANPPAKQDMVQFLQTVLTKDSSESPGCEIKRPDIEDLWKPIISDEIKRSFPEMTTSPGPDGLPTLLKAIPLHILTGIFNLFLLCGRLPKHLLKARTTLIPKKKNDGQIGCMYCLNVHCIMM